MADEDVSQPNLVLSQDDGAVRVLVLNRPSRHNALVPELVAEFRAAIAAAAAQPEVRAVVIAAEGRSFSTGGDVAEFARRSGPELAEYARRIVGGLHELVLELLEIEVPVVAAVHGTVTGGSLGLVLASDVVLVGPGATFAPYYVTVGFSPDGGWTALLPQHIGAARALAWQLGNETVHAETAVAWGLAHQVCADPRAAAIALARRLATKQPAAVARTKRLVRGDLNEVRGRLDAELDSFVAQITTDEAARGMRAFLGTTTS